MKPYDLIVVGGGHAGIEAAHAAARMGAQTLLISMSLDGLGKMSCNPAIGGVSKGNLVVELDALGGIMPLAADACSIQTRILNRSRGPAVRGLRAQEDRDAYSRWMKVHLVRIPGLIVRQGVVSALSVKGGKIQGVEVLGEGFIPSRAVILTTGTFLRGLIHIGLEHYPAGRASEPPSTHLAESLERIGIRLGRLKTGTPPRVLKSSINLEILERQNGERDTPPFSIRSRSRSSRQVPCYITYTSERVHDIVRNNIQYSPMYAGVIEGRGPRYCPSIEDKVMKFPHHRRHQIFIEPEGWKDPEVYLNGVSTNLPLPVQEEMIHAIPGMERAVIVRPGYAIEYDFADPAQLQHTLEVREVQNLYLAGQINGTSGYEEAACLGFLAGVNAVLSLRGEEPLVLRRDEAYMGVMVDDLVLKGVDEPYRMMTARAEFRLHLGYQTAYRRLVSHAERLSIMTKRTLNSVKQREADITEAVRELEILPVTPGAEMKQRVMEEYGINLQKETTAAGLFRRVRGELSRMLRLLGQPAEETGDFLERISYDLIYRHYAEKQGQLMEDLKKWESMSIPIDLKYETIQGLSMEMVERLSHTRPGTLAQAMRIPGVTPSAITALYVYLRSN
ncbi:MAG TPA: tRNA uridine-5-carboxymethylaminomethyl(34) synthesis enzyme MnmG [Thermoanaerobaculia bacterium]|nr:tRNA uridine-5-carboxymethylaminomethyl(34) synthesis enzyme MnmG [Thermoanaerobaculia bacterium]HUM29168.1 tRNA uridine-5-carboxymethylaminomethyl(34) synthesis enzyme MnmG [Thermoanaerobaculia bacterium]HXK67546.1 tRNA uridine-5-carboxymethylaminomethyl(34) synthesis enzyme MnmG [Thermoanaerobaculia bacterium]